MIKLKHKKEPKNKNNISKTNKNLITTGGAWK